MENQLIIESLNGNKKSLEKLIKSIDGYVYNLSIRFLWNKSDAEDATQEILIKVITNLGKFEEKSKFNTWVYRIAVNYLVNLIKQILNINHELTDWCRPLTIKQRNYHGDL